jgi:hypothetical protein
MGHVDGHICWPYKCTHNTLSLSALRENIMAVHPHGNLCSFWKRNNPAFVVEHSLAVLWVQLNETEKMKFRERAREGRGEKKKKDKEHGGINSEY